VSKIYEAKQGTCDESELYSEVKNGFLAVLEKQEIAEPKKGGRELQTTLMRSLSIHIEMKDNEYNFKIGDIVSAKPDGQSMWFEGIAVNCLEEIVFVDFGDNEEPAAISKEYVLRVRSGESLEVGDVVQCKPEGSPVYCIGKILCLNEDDGTFDVGYEGTDEVDERVASHYMRKVASGRSSGFIKLKKAINKIGMVRAFASNSAGFGLPKAAAESKGK